MWLGIVWAALAAAPPAQAVTHMVPAGGNIQQAINNAAAGDTVQLAAGTYNLTSTITAKNGVAIVGAGAGQTTLRVGPGVDRFVNLNSTSGVRLADMALDGASSSARFGVTASSGSGHVIEDMTIRNLGGNSTAESIGVYFSQTVTGSHIRRNTIQDVGLSSFWGTAIRIAHGSSNTIVEHNTISGVGRGGILANDNSTNLTIRNNTVTRIGVNNPSQSGEPTPRLGIELWGGCSDSLIQSNTVDHYISIDESSRIAVRDNTIQRPDTLTTRAFTALELAGGSAGVRDVVLTGNRLVKTADPSKPSTDLGVSISGGGVVEHALFQGNILDGSGTWGTQIQGENNTTGVKRRLYFLDNTFSNTRDGNPGPYVSYGPQGEAIRLHGEAGRVEDLVFIDSTITDNHGNALNVLNPNGKTYVNDIRLTDNIATGNDNDTMNTIGSPQTPDAMIVQIIGGADGQPVQLKVSFADRPVQHALWDLGFGLPLTGDTISQVLPHGEHNITVVAWDANGNADHAVFHLDQLPEPTTALLLLGALPFFCGRPLRHGLLVAAHPSCCNRSQRPRAMTGK